MLISYFGYTGIENAKFGQIQIYGIMDTSGELLLQIRELAENISF